MDKHIRRLDEDLKKFENELKQEQELQQQQTQQVLKAKGKQKAHTPASRLRNMQEQEDSHIISADQYVHSLQLLTDIAGQQRQQATT